MAGVKIYLELFWTFFRIGAVTFGGGIAMLPVLDRELCQKKGWVSQSELIDYYAVGQATPGIIAVNVATFCGHKLRGTLGGAVATLAIVTPSIIVISLLASCINTIDQIPVMKKALMGINVAVAANLSYSIIKLFRKTVSSIFALVLFVAAFALVFFFKFSATLVIFASAILGVAIFGARKIFCKPKDAAPPSGPATGSTSQDAAPPPRLATDSTPQDAANDASPASGREEGKE